MLAGPDLFVILIIALIVFGPKKLPELAKTIGKAMGEFRKTTEEVRESIGIRDLEKMRSNLSGIDLLTHLAEKTSEYMKLPDKQKEQPTPKDDPGNGETLSVTFTPLEKQKGDAKSGG